MIAAGKKGDNKAFAPWQGSVDAYKTPSALPRHLQLTLEWENQLDIYAFNDGEAYEHDFKLANDRAPEQCPDVRDHHWAYRVGDEEKDGVAWRTTLPAATNPYLDTQLLDSCTRMDFTVGMFDPQELNSQVSYEIYIDAGAGSLSTEDYMLNAQAAPNDCKGLNIRLCVAPFSDKRITHLQGDALYRFTWRPKQDGRPGSAVVAVEVDCPTGAVVFLSAVEPADRSAKEFSMSKEKAVQAALKGVGGGELESARADFWERPRWTVVIDQGDGEPTPRLVRVTVDGAAGKVVSVSST